MSLIGSISKRTLSQEMTPFHPSKQSKTGYRRSIRGSMILEVSIGFGVLLSVAFLMLKAAGSVSSGQRWTVMQAMTDAFMTKETAVGNRWPFDEFKANGSPWPTFPTLSQETVVIGKLPGGIPITANLRRTKYPAPNNLADSGGGGSSNSNPASTEGWKLQSLLTYKVGSRNYVKSRTTLRVK